MYTQVDELKLSQIKLISNLPLEGAAINLQFDSASVTVTPSKTKTQKKSESTSRGNSITVLQD